VRDAIFDQVFLDELRQWVATDRKVTLRVLDIIDAVRRDPFAGIGKPEPLRHFGSDTWSRRLTHKDRIGYRVLADRVIFVQCRFHYE